MSSSSSRQRELAEQLTAAGLVATADPRSATPPCVLVPPPRRLYDVGCGYSAEWELVPIVPGPGNADADVALSTMVDQLAALLPVTGADPTSYVLSPDNPPFPAYRVRFLEGIDPT
jgi:hypothetical protein